MSSSDARDGPASAADLPPELAARCLLFLGADCRSLLRASLACRAWRDAANGTAAIWAQLCDAYGVAVEDGGEDGRAAALRAAFAAFGRAHGPLRDAHAVHRPLFDRLKTFLQDRSPRTLALFRPGRDPAPLWRAQAVPGIEVPAQGPVHPDLAAFLLWYSFLDGQELLVEDGPEEPPEDHGLFGTLTAYDEFVSVRMLPSGVVRTMPFEGTSASLFALCMRTGRHLAFLSSAPPDLQYRVVEMELGSPRYLDRGPFGEFMSSWVASLEGGEREVDGGGRISMFREDGPGTGRAVTRGIEVRVSSLFAPEHRAPGGQFVYRIRLAFHPEQCPYPSAQLESRRWRIGYRSGAVETVEGRAVVGHYPHLGLAPARTTFEYCSFCTGRSVRRGENLGPAVEGDPFPRQDPPVWMEGAFVFVPGSLRNPIMGEPKFEVEVARWYFEHPRIMAA